MCDLRGKFTRWYVRRGYTYRAEEGEGVWDCPWWVRPLLRFFSPSVYFVATLGKALADGINAIWNPVLRTPVFRKFRKPTRRQRIAAWIKKYIFRIHSPSTPNGYAYTWDYMSAEETIRALSKLSRDIREERTEPNRPGVMTVSPDLFQKLSAGGIRRSDTVGQLTGIPVQIDPALDGDSFIITRQNPGEQWPEIKPYGRYK